MKENWVVLHLLLYGFYLLLSTTAQRFLGKDSVPALQSDIPGLQYLLIFIVLDNRYHSTCLNLERKDCKVSSNADSELKAPYCVVLT